MTNGEAARRQQCRALVFAAVLGVVFAGLAAIESRWAQAAVAAAGALVALAVYRRRCGSQADPHES